MSDRKKLEALYKANCAASIALNFLRESRVDGQRGAAIQNLRIGLKREGLWLGEQDEELLHQVRAGTLDYEQLRGEICSAKRTGYTPDPEPPHDVS